MIYNKIIILDYNIIILDFINKEILSMKYKKNKKNCCLLGYTLEIFSNLYI